jgi:hypothetical protein
MNRLLFYNIVTNNGVEELDYLYNNLTKFKMSYPAGYYMVKEDDLMRPDLISYKVYGTVKYWWLIMMVNGIGDIFSDLEVGLTLQIPNILDIFTFYKKWSLRT